MKRSEARENNMEEQAVKPVEFRTNTNNPAQKNYIVRLNQTRLIMNKKGTVSIQKTKQIQGFQAIKEQKIPSKNVQNGKFVRILRTNRNSAIILSM